MRMDFEGLNLWAIVVAALAYFVIGAIWYTALFAKAWIRGHRFSEADVASMRERQNPAVVFPSMLACNLVTGVVLAMLLRGVGAENAGDGAMVGGVVWLGFAGACAMVTHLGALRPMMGFAIDTAYHLVALMVMGAILGAWR